MSSLDKYREKIEELSIKIKNSVNLDNGWEEYDKDHELTCYRRYDGNAMSFLGKMDLPYSSTKILEIISSTEKRKVIDPMFEQGTEILHIGDNFSVDHFIYKDQWPASGRDFVTASYYTDNFGQISMYVWTPEDENQACELVPGKVRGKIEYGGYIITPLTLNSCHVDYTVCMNLGGALPTFIANMVLQSQPRELVSIKNYLDKMEN